MRGKKFRYIYLMNPYPAIETERLILRATAIEDAELIYALQNTEGWLKFIGDRGVRSVKDAERYIAERMMPQYMRLGFSNNTIFLKSDGSRIGVAGLYAREGLDHVDLGFALLPVFMRNGYIREAGEALLHAATHVYQLKQVDAITTEENVASQQVLRGLGFSFVKRTRLPDDPEELLLFTRLLEKEHA